MNNTDNNLSLFEEKTMVMNKYISKYIQIDIHMLIHTHTLMPYLYWRGVTSTLREGMKERRRQTNRVSEINLHSAVTNFIDYC